MLLLVFSVLALVAATIYRVSKPKTSGQKVARWITISSAVGAVISVLALILNGAWIYFGLTMALTLIFYALVSQERFGSKSEGVRMVTRAILGRENPSK